MHIIREFVRSFILKTCVVFYIILNNNLKPGSSCISESVGLGY